MIKLEILALALSKMSGGLDDPASKAFKLKNPGMLKSYRPEKKVDEDNYRIFTSAMGGLKALIADLAAKSSGKSHHLSEENTLKELLVMFGYKTDASIKPILSFLRRGLNDEGISGNTTLNYFLEVKENK